MFGWLSLAIVSTSRWKRSANVPDRATSRDSTFRRRARDDCLLHDVDALADDQADE